MISAAILTISDRSFQNIRPDSSGPALAEYITSIGWNVLATRIVPDEMEMISSTLVEWADANLVNIIITTGGTGFAPRDITPEATLAVIHRLAPGLAEGMRLASYQKTPHAMLMRGICGIRNRTLIINLPGSPKAAVENLEFIQAVIPHAIELLIDSPDGENHHK